MIIVLTDNNNHIKCERIKRAHIVKYTLEIERPKQNEAITNRIEIGEFQ